MNPSDRTPLENILAASQGQRPQINPSNLPKSSRPRTTHESVDEKCWMRCKQTNVQRTLGQEPRCTAYCYMNFRNQIASMTPLPGLPGGFIARESQTPTPPEEGIDYQPRRYHWNWLDGRYIYKAVGGKMIARHMEEMSKGPGIETLENIQKRCAKQFEEQVERAKQEQMQVVALPTPEALEFESIISLSELVSDSLTRFHLHIERIYGPGLRNIAKIPEYAVDGTLVQTASLLASKVTDGSAAFLAMRMWDSTVEVGKRMFERSKGSGNQSGFPTM